ncbi:MAG: PQQ-binding-like beta-propeller repeat protein [Mariniblastus sp.]
MSIIFKTVSIVSLMAFLSIVDSGGVSCADDWSQWLGDKRDSVWRETGVIKSIPESGLKAVWRTPIAGGFSGPAVAGDRVFVTDYLVKKGEQASNPGKRDQLEGSERLHCLDLKTGKPIWQKSHERSYSISYGQGPRATPTVDGDKVYVLGAEGHLDCYAVADGAEVWSRDLKKDFKLLESPIWGYAAHPLVYHDMLICMVGGEGSCAVAFNKNTGEEIWRGISTKKGNPGYCPPTVINAGGADQVLIFTPESISGLNPKTGESYWSVKVAPAYEMSIIAPIKHGDYLLVTALSNGSVLLKLDSDKPAVTEVWREKGVSPDHNPPIVFEDHIYGIDVNGRMRCIELVSGKRVWESLATCPNGRPASSTTGFVVRNGDHWYITTEQGELIIAKMSPAGFEELGRAKMVEPTSMSGGRKIVWSHPAFANKCVFVRNDKEIVCYSLAE